MAVYSESMEAIFITYLMDVDAGMDKGKCPPELRDFIEEAQKDAHMIPAQEASWFIPNTTYNSIDWFPLS